MCDTILNMSKTSYAAVVGIVIGIIIVLLYQQSTKIDSVTVTTPTETIKSVTFGCDNNKKIQTVFYDRKVELALSDSRHLLLLQAISASGARYTNTDQSLVFWNKGSTAFVEEGDKITYQNCDVVEEPEAAAATSTQLANPASVNCTKLGGKIIIQKRGDGGEYGLCQFDENRACEEWALTKGDCPVGGRKTTGYDTIDQNYCAWSGGETYAGKNSICKFRDGSKCSTVDYYNGKCGPSSN